MKKLIFILPFSLSLMILGGAQAQEQSASLDQKRWNITANPFGYFLGNFNVNVQYAVHENIAVGLAPTFYYGYYFEPNVIGAGGRASVAAYFDQVYDGFHLDAGMTYLRLQQDRKPGDVTANDVTANIYYPDLLASWAWLWDSGFNAFIGIGLGYYFGDGEDLSRAKVDFEGVGFSGKLGFGYAF